jgi:L-galactono-1,4-lactone dehydrogenase
MIHTATAAPCCRFADYVGLEQDKLMPSYNATWHWAKIEPPTDPQRLAAMRSALAQRFPLERFNAHRARLDPDNILGNRLLDGLIGTPSSA